MSDISFKRPSGGIPIAIGWSCLAISMVLFLVSFGQGPSRIDILLASGTYASADSVRRVAEAAERGLLLQIGAGGFFSLFLALWSVGYIVRAISFLPASNREEVREGPRQPPGSGRKPRDTPSNAELMAQHGIRSGDDGAQV